jgi:hypothetical protein
MVVSATSPEPLLPWLASRCWSSLVVPAAATPPPRPCARYSRAILWRARTLYRYERVVQGRLRRISCEVARVRRTDHALCNTTAADHEPEPSGTSGVLVSGLVVSGNAALLDVSSRLVCFRSVEGVLSLAGTALASPIRELAIPIGRQTA